MLLGGLFSELVDRRKAKGKRYQLEPLLCGLLLAILSGATSFRKMEAFLKVRLEELNALFGTQWKNAPSWVGIRKFLLTIEVMELEAALRRQGQKKHAKEQTEQEQQQPGHYKLIAIDGKALRGSAQKVHDIRAKQLVSLFAQDDLMILGHMEVADKSNEIPAAQTLIQELSLQGCLLTLDALHCQKKTLQLAKEQGAEVLVQVKENQKSLHLACTLAPKYQACAEQHVSHDKGHGRSEQRTVSIYTPPLDCWFGEEWQSLIKMAVRVERQVSHKRRGKQETSIETAWWISTVVLSAEQFQDAIRGHWSIENQNHYVRDTALNEDACRIREQPGILARLRSMALNCLRSNKVPSISRAIYTNSLSFKHVVAMAQCFN